MAARSPKTAGLCGGGRVGRRSRCAAERRESTPRVGINSARHPVSTVSTWIAPAPVAPCSEAVVSISRAQRCIGVVLRRPDLGSTGLAAVFAAVAPPSASFVPVRASVAALSAAIAAVRASFAAVFVAIAPLSASIVKVRASVAALLAAIAAVRASFARLPPASASVLARFAALSAGGAAGAPPACNSVSAACSSASAHCAAAPPVCTGVRGSCTRCEDQLHGCQRPSRVLQRRLRRGSARLPPCRHALHAMSQGLHLRSFERACAGRRSHKMIRQWR